MNRCVYGRTFLSMSGITCQREIRAVLHRFLDVIYASIFKNDNKQHTAAVAGMIIFFSITIFQHTALKVHPSSASDTSFSERASNTDRRTKTQQHQENWRYIIAYLVLLRFQVPPTPLTFSCHDYRRIRSFVICSPLIFNPAGVSNAAAVQNGQSQDA